MASRYILLGLVPVLVLAVFLVHWRVVAGIGDPAVRLSRSRFLYLALSLVLLAFAWFLFILLEIDAPRGYFVPIGATFAFIGDYFNLQFRPAKRITGNEPVFGGILAFCATQVCYILAFLAFVDISILVVSGVFMPLVVVLLLVPCAVFVLRVYHPALSVRMIVASLVYGCLLGLMATFALCGALLNDGPWVLIAGGAFLFMLSDARMGATTVRGRHPPSEFQVPWFTYLAAQALILCGFALLFS
jgi:hypothetical protein